MSNFKETLVDQFVPYFFATLMLCLLLFALFILAVIFFRWVGDSREKRRTSGLHEARLKRELESGAPEDRIYAEATAVLQPVSKELDLYTSDYTRLLTKYSKKFAEMEFSNPHQLAAGELFTEKAQIFLADRAQQYYLWGSLYVICAIFSLCLGIVVIAYANTPKFIQDIVSVMKEKDITFAVVAIYFIRSIAIGGLFGGIIYYFASLSKAYFHEGTVLFNRRHATRLGRLYMIIRYGEPKSTGQFHDSLAEAVLSAIGDAGARSGAARRRKGRERSAALADLMPLIEMLDGKLKVSPHELEEAFGWNLVQNTAFKDIKPEKMTASLYAKLAESLGEAMRSSRKKDAGA